MTKKLRSLRGRTRYSDTEVPKAALQFNFLFVVGGGAMHSDTRKEPSTEDERQSPQMERAEDIEGKASKSKEHQLREPPLQEVQGGKSGRRQRKEAECSREGSQIQRDWYEPLQEQAEQTLDRPPASELEIKISVRCLVSQSYGILRGLGIQPNKLIPFPAPAS